MQLLLKRIWRSIETSRSLMCSNHLIQGRRTKEPNGRRLWDNKIVAFLPFLYDQTLNDLNDPLLLMKQK